MPKKGRYWITVELKSPELRDALNMLVEKAKVKDPDMNLSMYVRKLIREAIVRQHIPTQGK